MSIRLARLGVLLGALLPFAGFWPAAAQEPMITDRPDFTESAFSIPTGYFQLEAGFTFEDGESGDFETYGEALLRVGLTPRWEARLGIPSYGRFEADGMDASGFLDASLGAKVELDPWGQASTALLVSTSVPTASGDFESSHWQPEVLLALSWDLDAGYGLGANLGYTHAYDGNERFAQLRASVGLGIPVSDRLGAFVEMYGFSEESEDGSPTLYADAGLTYALSEDLQLDVRVGHGFADSGTDLFFGAGVSTRW